MEDPFRDVAFSMLCRVLLKMLIECDIGRPHAFETFAETYRLSNFQKLIDSQRGDTIGCSAPRAFGRKRVRVIIPPCAHLHQRQDAMYKG